MIHIVFGLLVFVAVIVVAGFNKLYSLEALIKNRLRTEKEFKKDFLIALGWKKYNHLLWYINENELYNIDDAYKNAIYNYRLKNNYER